MNRLTYFNLVHSSKSLTIMHILFFSSAASLYTIIIIVMKLRMLNKIIFMHSPFKFLGGRSRLLILWTMYTKLSKKRRPHFLGILESPLHSLILQSLYNLWRSSYVQGVKRDNREQESNLFFPSRQWRMASLKIMMWVNNPLKWCELIILFTNVHTSLRK